MFWGPWRKPETEREEREREREREERRGRTKEEQKEKEEEGRKWKRRKKERNKLFEESLFWGKRAKPSEIAGKLPFLVSGLSYFSLDSGCFCLTSVLIFFCFSSVCLLSSFYVDSGFLIQGSSVLILPVLLLSCNEQMGIPETRKSRYPKKALANVSQGLRLRDPKQFWKSREQSGESPESLPRKCREECFFRNQELGVFRRAFLQNLRLSWLWRCECQMYCWAQYPWVCFVSLAVTLDSAENLKPPLLGPWFLDCSRDFWRLLGSWGLRLQEGFSRLFGTSGPKGPRAPIRKGRLGFPNPNTVSMAFSSPRPMGQIATDRQSVVVPWQPRPP